MSCYSVAMEITSICADYLVELRETKQAPIFISLFLSPSHAKKTFPV